MIILFTIYLVCYVVFFPVQAFFTIVFAGPFGLVSAWVTVLQQAGFISALICGICILPEVQKSVFDTVLSQEIKGSEWCLERLRLDIKVPFYVQIGSLIFTIPAVLILPFVLSKGVVLMAIGLIPVMGAVIVALIQASSTGLKSHSRYFALKGYSDDQVRDIYRANTAQYIGFGIVANFLLAIPLLGLFFMFTNAVGAALWAVSIERKSQQKSR